MAADFFKNSLKNLDEAGRVGKIDSEVLKILQSPERTLEANLPVRMDSGELKIFKAWRVQYSSSLGPYKGGIRFHPESSLEEVEALSFLMTFKNAALGLAFGGGKGAVKVNPKEMSSGELERLSRAFVRGFYDVFGPDKDVPAPDVNTNPTVLGWMSDEFDKIAGKKTPRAFTGKPLELGGIVSRESSTGYGGFIVIREILKFAGYPSSALKVAVQGFGNVGSHLAEILDESGFRVVAVSDSKSALYANGGLDIRKIIKDREKEGRLTKNICYYKNVENLSSEEGCEVISNEDLLKLDTDILIPAAIEGAINASNAGDIKAKIILEMSNGGISENAYEILAGKNILVIPDILANGGGVAGSFLEWLSNRENRLLGAEKEFKKLEEYMANAAKNIWDKSLELKTNLRIAAYVVALERLSKEIKNKI
ncbi:Glu/Leu/Phe/Val dehydrogenase [Candidatus Giovannonibacteria bacterium]|nr:Glu/Leu/Phe/Val dehydrogenase [Candidatus Giovannonibacteria bacterium]